MKRKRKELPPHTESDYPRLSEGEREPIEGIFFRDKNNGKRRWQRIYMASTTAALVLSLCLLSFLFGAHSESFDFSDVSLWISNLFQNCLGDGGGEDPDESSPDILDDLFPPTDDPLGEKPNEKETSEEKPPAQNGVVPLTKETLYLFDYDAVPEGQTPIVPMDLSLVSYGASYIYNATGLKPNTEALLKEPLKKGNETELLAVSDAPLVLIVHTHGTEAYSEDGAISYLDDGKELARSYDPNKSVVSVGSVIAEALAKAGISTIHCTVMHDQPQYKDSYARAEETIRQYLERYPSIQLVIDVHRDSIVKSTGELVRPVTLIDGEAAAQVMCVVGSNWNGEKHPNWEGNLALALKLRERVNGTYENLCRPPYLKSSTYNQELAPYSLLLEIGASGNSLAEAKRSGEAIGEVLSSLLKEIL